MNVYLRLRGRVSRDTDKALIVRAIHFKGPRSESSCGPVECPSLMIMTRLRIGNQKLRSSWRLDAHT
jgi:hypothetical protein